MNGTADQFTFVYRPVKGDVTIVAKVAAVANVDPWSQAGVMLRESLNAGAGHAYLFASAANGVRLRSRRDTGKSTEASASGAGAAPVWLKLERRSSTVIASRSTDGVSWTVVKSLKQPMNQSLLVGLAVASHTAGASTSAGLQNVTINGAPVGATVNAPPAVSLTSPSSGASFTAPASIALAASASDSDGSVSKVDFYAGSTLLGSDTSSPYAFSWSSVPAGTHALKAVATDNAGAATTSATVNVTVGAANVAPTVSLTSPGAGASFTAPASIALAASASDSNGSVSKVDFYAGSTFLGSDATSPYAFTWNSVPAGTHVLKAVATDNAGASTTSAIVTVTVTAANVAPTVSLTSPSSGATFTAPASVVFTAAASDTDGTIQRVDFYVGSVLIGSDTTSPYSFTWPSVALGSYSVSAVARDNLGATTVSAWRDFTVANVPSTAVFAPAVVPDPISYYVLEVFAVGSDPTSAAPIASQNLGLPPVVDGECTADVRSLMLSLAPGSYIATVSSVSAVEGVLRSPSFAFTR